ncbi:MAG: tRNA 2-selenouridine(34) synthase MnmH [Endozoicomonas sp.]
MSQKRADTEDYLSLFLNDIPLMDVRAPVEYAKGAFPSACNRPILNDEQREVIGTCYKQEGNEAAVELGYKLATDEIRQQRLGSWQQFVSHHPEGYLYCFRGGQRSHITQQWLAESGHSYPLIKGGYKALRRFLIDELAESIEQCRFIILSGKTGTGKTRLIHQLNRSADLEGMANHRGSSFGRRQGGQPTQIDFENRLSIALLKHRHRHNDHPTLLEDESKLIGRCSLPQELRDKMQQSPIILLEEPIDHRIEIGLQEYVTDNLADFQQAYGEDAGFEQFAEGLNGSLYRIRRRLGGERYQALSSILENAIKEHCQNNCIDGYRELIRHLLENYYDPMYEYQLEQKKGSVIFRGDRHAIVDAYGSLTADL